MVNMVKTTTWKVTITRKNGVMEYEKVGLNKLMETFSILKRKNRNPSVNDLTDIVAEYVISRSKAMKSPILKFTIEGED